jgi:transposase-like protein
VDGIVDHYVKNEATIFTDEYVIYNNLINHDKVTNHYTTNHGKGEYAKGEIHVNNDKNRHSLPRRFLKIFRRVSKENLQGYALLEQYKINHKIDSYDTILETILK